MKVIYAGPTHSRVFSWFQEHCRIYDVEWAVATNENLEQTLKSFPYDYGIGYLFEKKIPRSEFNLCKQWLNFHPGPLPEMGGRNLAYHAIKKGFTKFGASIQWMDENFDTGPIIETEYFEIKPSYTAHDLVRISHSILEAFFYKYIPQLFRGEIKYKYEFQTRHTITYFKKQEINDFVSISENQEKEIKALYCPPYYPSMMVGGERFILIKDE